MNGYFFRYNLLVKEVSLDSYKTYKHGDERFLYFFNITLTVSAVVWLIILHTLDQGQQTFSVKSQIENTLDFAGYM